MCMNRTHVRCHPYSIPQPVKVGHTTGVYDPYSFRIVLWVLLCLKNKSGKVLWDGTCGFSSLSEKTRKYNHLQMSLHRQHFLLRYLRPWLLLQWGLSLRPPAWQTGALPTELMRWRSLSLMSWEGSLRPILFFHLHLPVPGGQIKANKTLSPTQGV